MPRPSHFTPRKGAQYPLYRRLGGPQGQSEQVGKISLPSGYDPRTVQPVATRPTRERERVTVLPRCETSHILSYEQF